MSEITNPSLKNTVRQHFASLGEDAPTWTEIHGMLCALAVGPEAETVDYAAELEMPVPEEVCDALNRLKERLVTQLLGGDAINLPCLLAPYQDDDGQDLASGGAGFTRGGVVGGVGGPSCGLYRVKTLILPVGRSRNLSDCSGGPFVAIGKRRPE